MKEYHKIQTVFKRDPDTKFRTLLMGEYSEPEFDYLKNNIWNFTEKVDGTNIRVMWDGTDVKFGGKTDNAQIPTKLLENLMYTFTPNKMLKVFDKDPVCLYGEGYGAKIQSGGKYRDDQGFVLFDAQIDGWWIKRKNLKGMSESLNIDMVPLIGSGTLGFMVNFVKEGITSIWGDFKAEGVVARPEIELFSRSGHRIITKLKYKDFNTARTKQVINAIGK